MIGRATMTFLRARVRARRHRALVLTVVVDSTGETWRHVPGYGPVAWSPEQISEHADHVSNVHRPDPVRWRARRDAGVGLGAAWPIRRCKLCLTAWPCRETRWARWWLTDGRRTDG